MDVATITSLIGSLGFPIAMCLTMFYYMNKERETHAEELAQLNQSIINNTQAINDLKIIMSSLNKGV